MKGCKKPLIYSILSLVISIIAWNFFQLAAVVSLVLGIIALIDLHKNFSLYSSQKELKLASLVIGILGVVISILVLIACILGIIVILSTPQ